MGVDEQLLKRLKEYNSNQSFVLGSLANNEIIYPNIGIDDRAVTNSEQNGQVIIYLKAISPEPEPIKELNDYFKAIHQSTVYIEFDNPDIRTVFTTLPPEYKHSGQMEQREIFERAAAKTVFLFKPRIEIKHKDKVTIFVYKNINIINVDPVECIDLDKAEYLPLPQVIEDELVFEKQLLDGNSIALQEHNHYMPAPKYLKGGEYIYFGFDWKKDQTQKNTWVNSSPEIKKVKADDLGVVITASSNLKFVEKQVLSDIELSSQVEIVKEATTKTMQNDAETKIPPESAKETKDALRESELNFLKVLKNTALSDGLYYSMLDLVNFHVSVKSNFLTILSGMSGTGKTRLAMAYAKALGLTNDKKRKRHLVLPVSPSYTEPGDVLGYLNTTTNLYVPAETGLVDFLLSASKHPGDMHMVIFEEMNLSQIEHWFSPFISLLELDEEDRKLRLYNDGARPHNRNIYEPMIPIGQNVIFVGTVNDDETTRSFSDRLLDRANVVTLQKMDFVELREKLKEFEQKEDDGVSTEERSSFGLQERYTSWVEREKPWDVFEIEELKFFDQLHDIINRVDSEKGMSFRLTERMAYYLNNIPLDLDGKAMISREDALDIQIKQRLLTKIRGSIEQLEGLLGTLNKIDGKLEGKSKLYDTFKDDGKTISHFDRTLAEIRRKAWELQANGYAS